MLPAFLSNTKTALISFATPQLKGDPSLPPREEIRCLDTHPHIDTHSIAHVSHLLTGEVLSAYQAASIETMHTKRLLKKIIFTSFKRHQKHDRILVKDNIFEN